MPRGGKRQGAGRPKYEGDNRTEDVWLRLRIRTIKRLRAMIPNGKRSEFVSDCIDAHL